MMTLSETVLRKLDEWKPGENKRNSLFIPDEGSGWSVALTVDRQDEVGCLVWEVVLRRASVPEEKDEEILGKWASRAAQQVTSLLESLKVVEVDVQRQEALLRSSQPTRRGDALRYYEILLKGSSEAVVRRFQGFSMD